jgi:hypothetical protein
VNEPPKGALGVFVGLAVLVGGTRENGVFVGKGVMVGRGVYVGVNSSVGLGVQVDASWIGVTVRVGGAFLPGGRRLREDAGLIKIIAKYPTRQSVRSKTRIDNISQIWMGADVRLDCVPSKSKSSFIHVTPLRLR